MRLLSELGASEEFVTGSSASRGLGIGSSKGGSVQEKVFWKRTLIVGSGEPLFDLLGSMKWGRSLVNLFEQAGYRDVRESFLQWWLFAAAVLSALLLVFGSWAMSIAGIVLLVTLSITTLQNRASKKLDEMRSQLPDTLDELAQSLRAGRSFPQAVNFVYQSYSVENPLYGVLARLDAEASLGHSCSQSLRELSKTTKLAELNSLAAVIDITSRVGGSSPALFERLATSIRQDLLLNKKLRVQTAQSKSSVRLVGSVPFVLIGLMSLMMPGYLGLWLSTTSGQALFALALVLIVVGFLWVKQVVNIGV
jgi:tight adherence protein B